MKYQTLQIFRPCISKNQTQDWGENRACINSKTGAVYGVTNVCRSGDQSGYQSFGMRGHNGIDIGGLKGADIYHAATFKGWMKTESDRQGGLGVDVVSNEQLFFAGKIPVELRSSAVAATQDNVVGFLHHVKMRYWHLTAPVGSDGKSVTCGTVVGLMGNTGVSSGTHLHFAPKWCTENGQSAGSDNGYFGAFDPRPYYTDHVTAKEHSDMITKEAIPLSVTEVKDIQARLNTLQMLLLALQKLQHSL